MKKRRLILLDLHSYQRKLKWKGAKGDDFLSGKVTETERILADLTAEMYDQMKLMDQENCNQR